VSLWTLVLIGVVTAFVTVLLTDLTAGWSWVVGPLVAIGIVVVSGLGGARNSKTVLLDAGKLILILFITLPIALVAVIFFVWSL
jgi:hypothetical protein